MTSRSNNIGIAGFKTHSASRSAAMTGGGAQPIWASAAGNCAAHPHYLDGCIHSPSFLSSNSIKMALISPLVLSCLFGALAAYVINHLIRSKPRIPLPPGPRGLPLLGNVNDMPKDDGSLGSDHWLKHKDLYGPLSSVTVLGQTMIIINDEHIALEMLRDRAAKHSDRPHQVFSGEMYVTVNITYHVHILTYSQGGMEAHPCL
jgi:hypothetical protein